MELDCHVRDKEIIITSPGSDCMAVYHHVEVTPARSA
jgi:hypothetical protein